MTVRIEDSAQTASSSLVVAAGLCKSFGGVQALRGVDLEIATGEVHALVGENGAGKSTLIKVLAGSCLPDSGRVSIGGAALRLGDVRASELAGISVIHQEPTAFLHLSAEDNIFVGHEPRRLAGLLLDRKQMRGRARGLLERLQADVDPATSVRDLPMAQRQMVGIARALLRQSRLVVMDEPTASLSARETEALFRIIAQLRGEGASILYVSHRLEEIFQLADRVTVLRDGSNVATLPIGQVTRQSLVRLMVGREVAETAASATPELGPTMFHVEHLTRAPAVKDVTFSVRSGEIVGLGGLVGAGRSEVARLIFGLDHPDSGGVSVAEKKVSGTFFARDRKRCQEPFSAPEEKVPDTFFRLAPGSVADAMEAGVALVPEDRHREGLIQPMRIGDNLVLTVQRALSRCGFRSPSREAAVADGLIRKLSVKTPSARLPASSLSGGNQQKLVVGKWLAAEPRILILDEPTRGVDVGAKAEIHRLIRQLAAEGMAVLLISSELPELLALSHRVLVMRQGRLVGELSSADATPERVMDLAMHSAGAQETPA